MKDVLRTVIPKFRHVLLIESGRRELLEGLIPGIYKNHGLDTVIDVVTCYGGHPHGLTASSTIFRLSDYQGPGGRKRLVSVLTSNAYNVCGIICSGEVVMSRWKWYLAWHLPTKTFILNENGDYFWFDRAHLSFAFHFFLFRLGLSGAASVPTFLRLASFPIALLFLMAYAAFVKVRRTVRLRLS